MPNPWKKIDLETYEEHMKLDSIGQMQAMHAFMKDQLYRYEASTVMILGVAGGNGLDLVEKERFSAIYGVDVNTAYLAQCEKRFPALAGIFHPIEADLTQPVELPKAELIIANLLIEYIGYSHFQRIIKQVAPQYVSCLIQVDAGEGFTSESPYTQHFQPLHEVHQKIGEEALTMAMEEIQYLPCVMEEMPLPNDKRFLRLDYALVEDEE